MLTKVALMVSPRPHDRLDPDCCSDGPHAPFDDVVVAPVTKARHLLLGFTCFQTGPIGTQAAMAARGLKPDPEDQASGRHRQEPSEAISHHE